MTNDQPPAAPDAGLLEGPPRASAHAAAAAIAVPAARLTTRSERMRAFAILFVSMMCLGAGQSVMFAVLPSLARELGLSEFEASIPFVVSATVWVFSSSYWGGVSDKTGRRPVIIMGLAAFGVSFASFAAAAQSGTMHLLPIAMAYPLMIVTRALYGIFGSGASPAAQAYVAERTTREERTRGVAAIGAAFGLGTMIGPGAGALLIAFGLFAPFYFTALLAFASAAAIYFFLPERTRPAARSHPQGRLIWTDRRIIPFLVFGLGISTAAAIPVQTVGYLFIDVLHLTPQAAPRLTGIGLIASSAAALFAQLVIVQWFKVPAKTLIRLGCLVAVVSNLLFVFGNQFATLLLALAISGLGFGMARPGYGAAASLAVPPDEQGAIAGLVGATAGAGFITGPIIGTGLYAWHHTAPYVFAGALMGGMFVYALLVPALRDAGERETEEDWSGTQVTDG